MSGRRLVAIVVAAAGWAVVAVLGVTTIARLVAWDRIEVFAILDAFTLVVYLPAWVVAVVALWRRRWWLAGGAAAMVVAQVLLVAPELSATTSLPPHMRPAETFRVLDANVYQSNPSMAGYAREITLDRPDIVTLEEASPSDVRHLDGRHALDRLPYRLWNGASGSRSLEVASRFPLASSATSSIDGLPYLDRLTVSLPHGALALWVVHTTAPSDPGVRQWNDELDGVDRLLRARHGHPLLVVGDFNATWTNRGFRAILSTGLTDAAAARGDAFAMTWSQLTAPLPPLIRIDHVLYGPGLVVTAIRTQPGPGSDHRALLATVAVGR